MTYETEYIEFEDCKLIHQTDMAGLFEIPDQGRFWIPFSQVSEDSISKNGEEGTIWITEWICEQKGIEY